MDVLLGMTVFVLIAVIAFQSMGVLRQRSFVTQAVSDARQVGSSVAAYMTAPDADPGDVPVGELVEEDLDLLGVNMTNGNTAHVYQMGHSTWDVCVQNSGAFAWFEGDPASITVSGKLPDDGDCTTHPGGAEPPEAPATPGEEGEEGEETTPGESEDNTPGDNTPVGAAEACVDAFRVELEFYSTDQAYNYPAIVGIWAEDNNLNYIDFMPSEVTGLTKNIWHAHESAGSYYSRNFDWWAVDTSMWSIDGYYAADETGGPVWSTSEGVYIPGIDCVDFGAPGAPPPVG